MTLYMLLDSIYPKSQFHCHKVQKSNNYLKNFVGDLAYKSKYNKNNQTKIIKFLRTLIVLEDITWDFSDNGDI